MAARIALVVALLGAVVGATFALHDRIRNWRLGTLLYCLGLAAWVLVNLLADVGRLPLPADIGCDEGMANCGSDGPSWDLVYAAAPLTMATGAVVLAVQAVRRGLDEKRRPMPR